jgi:hypothetical protein
MHEHLSVQEWSELNKQAIGNGASGPRARLILAGLVLEGVVHEDDAFPEAHAVARDRRPLVRQVLAVHPPGHQVANVVFQNCAADHGDTISVPLR